MRTTSDVPRGHILQLTQQKESLIKRGHLLADPMHVMIAIPPKHAVLQVIDYIRDTCTIHLERVYGKRKRNFTEQNFSAREFFVSTVDHDEEMIPVYIR